MIYATWSKQNGPWLIKIPKDRFWGDQKPTYGDEVVIEFKNGRTELNYLAEMPFEDAHAWYFYEDPDPFGSMGLDDIDDHMYDMPQEW